MVRCDDPDSFTLVAFRPSDPARFPVGLRLPIDGDSVTTRVLRTGRSARINHEAEGSGAISELAREAGAWSTVGAPITVEGRLWGAVTVSWERPVPPAADAEARLVHFADLLATAIANADSRDQLAASRARLLTAGDEARRRVVRDLHDGGQQRLVHAIVTLKLAQAAMEEDPERARSLVGAALKHAEQSNVELRELAHGILPSVLTHGGLRAGIDAVVSRLAVPVHADVPGTRLPPEIEASAYFIVAEALTNVVKHAGASRADVTVALDDGRLQLDVRDDGGGDADPRGHGLLGIKDRVAALGGRLRIESPPGAGTRLSVELPVPQRSPHER
jgi:signal transduction histidine kinase